MTEEITKYKFHSTGQFRNAVKNVQNRAKFKGFDEDGNPIYDTTAIAPTLKYFGTCKLHGTNASIVIHSKDLITFNSKSQTLGKLDKNGEFTLFSDNSEFAQTMARRLEGVVDVITYAEDACLTKHGEIKYPIKISGEWCGQGIQKGVGISFLEKKSLFVFGVKVQDEWLPLREIVHVSSMSHNIYNIMDFPVQEIDIDFNNPVYSQNKLVEFTDQVEQECPVSKQLGITESLLGEGLVWIPADPELASDSGNWFKTKGEKHSVSKTKSVAAVCPEKLNSIQEFVTYAATINRMEQGLGEIGLDQKLTGKFIGWVSSDINKEEGDVLEENNLTMKDVGKYIATECRKFYLGKLNEM